MHGMPPPHHQVAVNIASPCGAPNLFRDLPFEAALHSRPDHSYLTRPYLPRSPETGRYLGVRVDSGLIAMAGNA